MPIFFGENNRGVSLILFLCHSVHLLTFSKCNNHSHCGPNSHENGSHCWSKMKKKIVVNTCSCWGSTKSNAIYVYRYYQKLSGKSAKNLNILSFFFLGKPNCDSIIIKKVEVKQNQSKGKIDCSMLWSKCNVENSWLYALLLPCYK